MDSVYANLNKRSIKTKHLIRAGDSGHYAVPAPSATPTSDQQHTGCSSCLNVLLSLLPMAHPLDSQLRPVSPETSLSHLRSHTLPITIPWPCSFLFSCKYLLSGILFVLCLLCQQGINSILFTAESPALGDYFLVNRINEGMPWHGWAVGEKTISQPHGVAQVLEKPHPRMVLSHLELI